MQYTAKALLGVGLSARTTPLWASQAIKKPTARNVIYIYLSGGMSHIDTFDPKPGWKEQGPVQTIDTNVAGIQVTKSLPIDKVVHSPSGRPFRVADKGRPITALF